MENEIDKFILDNGLKPVIGYDPDSENYELSWKYGKIIGNSEKLLKKYEDIIDWGHMSGYIGSQELIEKFNHKVSWHALSLYSNIKKVFDEEFVLKHKDKFTWNRLVRHMCFSEKFIETHHEELFSDHFEKGYRDQFNYWPQLSVSSKFSEKFMEKYEDQISWHYISYNQTLSEKFIIKYADRLTWHWILDRQNITENILIECKDYINRDYSFYIYINSLQKY